MSGKKEREKRRLTHQPQGIKIPDNPPGERPLLEDAREALLVFFRENTHALPEVTEKWFKLPNGAALLIEVNGGSEEYLRRLKQGEVVEPYGHMKPTCLSPQAKAYFDASTRELQAVRERPALELLRAATERLTQTEQRFEGNDRLIILRQLFHGRGAVHGHLVEQGAVRILPHGNNFRSMACLSAANDYMMADITYGAITDLGGAVAECFGYADMSLLQRRAVGKIFGKDTDVFYVNFTPIPKVSVPRDPEIALMQRNIVGRLQEVM